MKKESYQDEVIHISKNLSLLREQIRMAAKSIRMQRDLEIDLFKKRIEADIKELKYNKEIPKAESFLENGLIGSKCEIIIEDKSLFSEKKQNRIFSQNTFKELEKWEGVSIEVSEGSQIRKRKYFFYNVLLNSSTLLRLACDKRKLNPGHRSFEEDLRLYIQKNIDTFQNTQSSKILIVWIYENALNENITKPLYEVNESLRRTKYRISNLSNAKTLTTGDLSVQEIIQALDKEPIEHLVDEKKFVTWFLDLTLPDRDNNYTLIYSVKEEDLLKKSYSSFLILLPETLIAISIAFFIILVISKRLFRNINMLTQTAIKVNQGNKNIRSNVKGEDDIGILGEAFDSMLDFFENSIKTLDSKVEEKTKEITKSLEEKETLLKEIHHRVKNNLALTISLLELQEEEVKDDYTRKALVDIQERIFTMELLHRKLYESTNLNEIPFDDYINDLVRSISHSYDIQGKVDISVDVEKIGLNIETAMPYGIIINELVTNAFKYAFDDTNEAPKLQLNIKKEKNNIVLILKDNGVGLEKDFSELSDSTLGLKLIKTIVNYQLLGAIIYKYDNGANFIIKGSMKDTTNL